MSLLTVCTGCGGSSGQASVMYHSLLQCRAPLMACDALSQDALKGWVGQAGAASAVRAELGYRGGLYSRNPSL